MDILAELDAINEYGGEDGYLCGEAAKLIRTLQSKLAQIQNDQDEDFVKLPCRIGDKVYGFEKYAGKPISGVIEYTVQMIGFTKAGVHLKVRERKEFNKTYMLGKTVFLTREEAEIVLKGDD